MLLRGVGVRSSDVPKLRLPPGGRLRLFGGDVFPPKTCLTRWRSIVPVEVRAAGDANGDRN